MRKYDILENELAMNTREKRHSFSLRYDMGWIDNNLSQSELIAI